MNNKIIFSFLILATASVVLWSCKSTKTIHKAISTPHAVDSVLANKQPEINDKAKMDSQIFINSLVEKVAKQQVNFTTFNAKLNVQYSDDNQKQINVNANIRMYKDSLIWVSVNVMLGIEAFRLLVTKDSVFLLDKLKNTVRKRPISYLEDLCYLPLNITTLQQFIIGNPIFFDNANLQYNNLPNYVSLLHLGEQFMVQLNIDKKTNYIESTRYDENSSRRMSCNINFSDFEQSQNQIFSTARDISVIQKNTIFVSVNFKKYDFNQEVSFPFSLPKNIKYE